MWLAFFIFFDTLGFPDVGKMMQTNIFSLHVILCSQENSTWQIPETNADTREAHTHATAVQRRRSESCLTLAEVKRVRCPVYLLFLLSGSMHTTGSLSHRTQASTLPPRTPCIFFHSLPRSNHSPPIVECYLSHDYTWDPLASVPFLSSDQLLTPALYPLSFVLCPRINCELPGEQKRNWGSCGKKKKKKIDQGPGKLQKKKQKKTEDVSKCFLCNNFYPSHTFLLKATLLGTQKWVFLFGNNSRRASEATVKLLQSRCFFLSPINLTPTPPLSSFMLALAHQF